MADLSLFSSRACIWVGVARENTKKHTWFCCPQNSLRGTESVSLSYRQHTARQHGAWVLRGMANHVKGGCSCSNACTRSCLLFCVLRRCTVLCEMFCMDDGGQKQQVGVMYAGTAAASCVVVVVGLWHCIVAWCSSNTTHNLAAQVCPFAQHQPPAASTAPSLLCTTPRVVCVPRPSKRHRVSLWKSTMHA